MRAVMAVTIKDIARETGLSVATVSKYLNNIPIKKENQELIREAVRKLNYRPNQSARALRSRQEKTICILMSDLGNYFWGDTIFHISQFFSHHGFNVITRSYFFNRETEEELIQDLIAQHISGAVMLVSSSSDHLYTRFQEANIPVILLDQIPLNAEEHPVDCVVSDNYGGGKRLAEYLLENGHENVCIMSEFKNFYSVSTRVKGFCDTYLQQGIDLSSLPYNQTPPMTYIARRQIQPAAQERFRSLITSSQLPSAVYFTTYEVAIGALSGGNTKRIRIPEDISLVTFDDDILFRSLKFSMSCVEQDMAEVGIQASSILLRRIQGDMDDFPCHRVIDVVFHPRKSVRNLKA